MLTTTECYREARGLLQAFPVTAHGQSTNSCGRFRCPLQWAIAWFDAITRGNDRTALRIVEDDWSKSRWSFDEMTGVRIGSSRAGLKACRSR